MPEYTGKDMWFQWVTAGGTANMEADERTVNLNPSADFADASAGSDPRKRRIVTLKDTMISYSGVAQKGGTALEDLLAEGTEGTVFFGPEGTAVGKRKYIIGAFAVPKFAYKYADVTEISVEFTGNGDFTRTTWP